MGIFLFLHRQDKTEAIFLFCTCVNAHMVGFYHSYVGELQHRIAVFLKNRHRVRI